jgi:hypothetical protein
MDTNFERKKYSAQRNELENPSDFLAAILFSYFGDGYEENKEMVNLLGANFNFLYPNPDFVKVIRGKVSYIQDVIETDGKNLTSDKELGEFFHSYATLGLISIFYKRLNDDGAGVGEKYEMKDDDNEFIKKKNEGLFSNSNVFNTVLGCDPTQAISVASDMVEKQLEDFFLSFMTEEEFKTISIPVINLKQTFEDGVNGLNHAQIILPINTLTYLLGLGIILKRLGQDEWTTSISLFKGDNVSSSNITMLNEKILNNFDVVQKHNFDFIMAVFYRTLKHISRNICFSFNDKVSILFSICGNSSAESLRIKYGTDTYREISDKNPALRYPILSGETILDNIKDTVYFFLEEFTDPRSNSYVGDHSFDIRPVFQHYIGGNSISDRTSPYLVKWLEEYNQYQQDNLGINIVDDISSLKYYKDKIDCHMFERVIKLALINLQNVIKNKNKSNSWLSYKFFDLMIKQMYDLWSSDRFVAKIEGVDPIYVEMTDFVNSKYEVTRQVLDVNRAPYNLSKNRVKDILGMLVTRYCEAIEYLYLKTNHASAKEIEETMSWYAKRENGLNDPYINYDVDKKMELYEKDHIPLILALNNISMANLKRFILKGTIDYTNLKKIVAEMRKSSTNNVSIRGLVNFADLFYELDENGLTKNENLNSSAGEINKLEIRDILFFVLRGTDYETTNMIFVNSGDIFKEAVDRGIEENKWRPGFRKI